MLAGENAGMSVVGGTFGGTKWEIGNFEGICWVLTLVSYIYILHYIEDGFIHCNKVGSNSDSDAHYLESV